jgi:glycosyltransferase involved in cell wall biosynthesis
MKTICVITQSVYDSDPRVRRKAEALSASGYDVDALALRAYGGKAAYDLGGVHVRTCPLGKERGSLLRYAFEYAAFFLWACVRVTIQTWRRRYVVVDVNTLPDFLIFAGIFARWMGARLVLDMHEITPEFYMSKYGIGENSPAIRLLRYFERISFRFADRVVTVNVPILNLLCARGLDPAKTTVMVNAADEARFSGAISAAKAQHGDDTSKFVMMYHGTLTKIYGLDIAIEAFAQVHEEMVGAELWILGSGPEAGALNELVGKLGLESKVRLVGQVQSSSIPEWLTRCDIGILPIRRDVFLDFAFPNKLPEFIIMGKTVIVSRLKAIEYYFSDDALAYFEPNSILDLSVQMLRVYRDRELRNRLAELARKENEGICWDRMKARYRDLVDGLSDGRDKIGKSEADRAALRPVKKESDTL